ncbi:hypothetical protein UYA_15085 [Ectopseudomonas alcaliphila JAB1]|nr:N-acetylneuraminate synthase family protein [Pseudomonas alcaliphila]APU30974.1 hypothetical protein UYA_15085 [Pseudomonas alcaliphila JAB1]
MSAPVLPAYLVVELANAHGGDRALLESTISAFSEIDYPRKGLKFQIFKPDSIALSDFSWFPVYESLFLPEKAWGELISLAGSYGDVWIDIFDTYGVEVLAQNLEFCYGIKLQASVLENYEVLQALAQLDLADKRIMINVSGFELGAMEKVICRLSELSSFLILQIGYQSYPTSVQHTALQKIAILRATFPRFDICMADHADANTEFALQAPLLANALGCQWIEKHFCINRSAAKYDGFSALVPHEMQRLCDALQCAPLALHGEFISAAENSYLRKSQQVPVLAATCDIGHLFADEDFLYRRTAQVGLLRSEIHRLQAESRYVLRAAREQYRTLRHEDFRPANIGVIVAGRMKSSRLPQKAILPIFGVASVDRCLQQCSQIAGVNQVVLATSTLEQDDVLVEHTSGGSVGIWRGHPDDVISRYLGACDHYGLDVVIRVTADCPLILPEIMELLLQKHFESGADYTAAQDCAVGTAGEVISVAALRRIAGHFGFAEYSEYMTWYFRNNPEHFRINLVDLPTELRRDYRLTLDYEEDLQMFESLYSALLGTGKALTAEAVFAFLDENPHVSNINAHLTLKYKTDQSLINLLNEKTRIPL